MNSNSNGQLPFSVDSSQVQQTDPPAPRSVNTNTNTTGNTQNQPPSTSHDSQIQIQTQTQTTSGRDNLFELSKQLLIMNFGAAISLLQFALNSKNPNLNLSTAAGCIAFGFTFNMITILLQKDLPIFASIGAYAGALSSAIGFLAIIQIILPHSLLWIVWLAGGLIFLSFLCLLIKNRFVLVDYGCQASNAILLRYRKMTCIERESESTRVDTEVENADTGDANVENVDTGVENVDKVVENV